MWRECDVKPFLRCVTVIPCILFVWMRTDEKRHTISHLTKMWEMENMVSIGSDYFVYSHRSAADGGLCYFLENITETLSS